MTQATPPPTAPVATPSASPPAVPPGAAPAAVPVRRTGFDPATRRQTVIVAVVIAALFYGSQVLNEALPASAQGQVAPGAAVTIGPGAEITPLEGWSATPHDSGSGVRLEKGVVVVDLFPESFENAGDLARAYLDEALRTDATQMTASDVEVEAGTNGSAARFTYQGMFTGVDVAIEGEVTAIVIGGQGVIADAWSRQGDLATLLGEVHAMLETIEVGP